MNSDDKDLHESQARAVYEVHRTLMLEGGLRDVATWEGLSAKDRGIYHALAAAVRSVGVDHGIRRRQMDYHDGYTCGAFGKAPGDGGLYVSQDFLDGIHAGLTRAQPKLPTE